MRFTAAACAAVALLTACEDDALRTISAEERDPTGSHVDERPTEAPPLDDDVPPDEPAPLPDDEPAPPTPPPDEPEEPPPAPGFIPDCGDARLFDLAAVCGVSYRAVFLSTAGSPSGEGTEDDPVNDLATAIDRCDGWPCHVRATTGTFAAVPTVLPPCMYLDGGFDDAVVPWATTQEPTRIVVSGDGPAFTTSEGAILQRLAIEADGDGVVLGPGFSEVVDSTIQAGGRGLVAEGRGGGASTYVCRARASAEGAGFLVRDDEDGVYVEETELTGVHGLRVEAGAANVEVVASILHGTSADASLVGGAHHVTIEGSTFAGAVRALEVADDVHDVRVVGNMMATAAPPSDPMRNVVVEDNAGL